MLRHRSSPVPFVILTGCWSGERVLVRLLSASGAVRCSGRVLDAPYRRPAAHLRRVLGRAVHGDRAHGAVVHPTDLWLTNDLDPAAFVRDLCADGVKVVVLSRRRQEDSGLSRALCGRHGELLPCRAGYVHADEVAVYADHGRRAKEWLDGVVPGALQAVFEDHLTDNEARSATADRLARFLDLPGWEAPAEPEPPTTEALWRRVANPDQLRSGLQALGVRVPDLAPR